MDFEVARRGDRRCHRPAGRREDESCTLRALGFASRTSPVASRAAAAGDLEVQVGDPIRGENRRFSTLDEAAPIRSRGDPWRLIFAVFAALAANLAREASLESEISRQDAESAKT